MEEAEEALAPVPVPTASELPVNPSGGPPPSFTPGWRAFPPELEMERFEHNLRDKQEAHNPLKKKYKLRQTHLLRIPEAGAAFNHAGNVRTYSQGGGPYNAAAGRMPTMDALLFERSFDGWKRFGETPTERADVFDAAAKVIANYPLPAWLKNEQHEVHVIDGVNLFAEKNFSGLNIFEAARQRLAARRQELQYYGPVILIQRTNNTEQFLKHGLDENTSTPPYVSRNGLRELYNTLRCLHGGLGYPVVIIEINVVTCHESFRTYDPTAPDRAKGNCPPPG